MKAPSSWKIMDLPHIQTLLNLKAQDIKLVGAFTAKYYDVDTPIAFYKYNKMNDDFIFELDNSLTKLDELNKFVDGDPTEPDYESTATDEVVFHSNIINAYGEFYVAVIKHFVSINTYLYSMQIFLEKENSLFACQTTLTIFNEANAEIELCENKLILDIYKTLSLI